MGLRFTCPKCAGTVTTYNHAPGEQIICSLCDKDIVIPLDPEKTEHIFDATSLATDPTAARVAAAARERWNLTVKLLLWLLLIVNPIVGINILTGGKEDPASTSVSMIIVGILLIVSVIFVVAVMRRRRWGVWGYSAIYACLILLCTIQMNWRILIDLLLGFGALFLVAKSEWHRLK